MSKAILEFNLPEDQDDFEMAHKGADYHNALFTFKEAFLRTEIKYGPSPEFVHQCQNEMGNSTLMVEPEVVHAVLEAVRTKFFETLSDCDVELI